LGFEKSGHVGAGGFSDLVRDIAESPVSQEEDSYPRFEQIGYNVTSQVPLGCPSRQIVKADRPDLHRCIAKEVFRQTTDWDFHANALTPCNVPGPAFAARAKHFGGIV
jgi:hypothetical protein